MGQAQANLIAVGKGESSMRDRLKTLERKDDRQNKVPSRWGQGIQSTSRYLGFRQGLENLLVQQEKWWEEGGYRRRRV